MKFALKLAAVAALTLGSAVAFAQQGQTVKIAFIDPLSGLMAASGTNGLQTAQYFADKVSKHNPAGVRLEVVGIDNKVSPSETVAAVRSAQDQGIRYVLQGNGSGPALAIIDALEKNNMRTPDRAMLYFNYAAVDPDLTNSKCSYWQYAFDANSMMKMQALTDFIKDMPEIKKVYIIGQNYSHGQQTSRFAKQFLKAKRPDIQIVGDELHPMAQIRDFSPYIAKIKASGADTVITGNWGSDLVLLIKAANDAGLKTRFLTYYAAATGVPTAMGAASEGLVYAVGYGYSNMPGDQAGDRDAYRKRYKDDLVAFGIETIFKALTEGIAKARSTDPIKVAAAMEGLKLDALNGEVLLRRDDHQAQMGLYISRWEKTDAQNPFSPEDTGLTFKLVKFYDAQHVSTPTTCQMKRPAA